jgi:seryl-tRNA synthetase
MLDINQLRNDLPGVAAALAKRGVAVDGARFEALERERKSIQTRTQQLQASRNALSRQVGIAKGSGQDVESLMREVAGAANELKDLERELENVQAKLRDFLLELPNVTHATTPAGQSADDNVEVRRHGEPRSFGFAA